MKTLILLNPHYVEFGDTGRGYYTEHELSNIVDGSITYLK